MEEANRTSARSITPIDSSYNTDPDKDYYATLDRNFMNPVNHKRITSNEVKYLNLESSPSIGKFCSGCMRLERQVSDLKKKLQREKDKYDTHEKHIRQLDSLLQIKEKRLKEEEASLRSDKRSLDSEIDELKKLLQAAQMEKIKAENEVKEIRKENANLVAGMKKLESRNSEIQKMMTKFEEDRKAIEENVRKSVIKSLEERENSISKMETEIQLEYQKINYENELIDEKNFKLTYFEQNLIIQEQSIKLKFDELSSFSCELEKSKAKLESDQLKLEEESENQIEYLKSKEEQISVQEKALKSKLDSLDVEFNSLEMLKSKLQDQKLILDREISNFKYLQMEFLKDPVNISEAESEPSNHLEEREKYIEEMIEKLNEEEKKFEDRWNGFKRVEESLRKEVEFYKRKCEASEQKVFNESKEDLDYEYNQRELILQRKEEELLAIEEGLKKERKEIDSTAELIKSLNEDLFRQQKEQEEELELLNRKKVEIEEMMRNQEIREKIIDLKERELEMRDQGSQEASSYREPVSFEDEYN